MKLKTIWKDKMLFETTDGSLSTTMDAKAPIGGGTALSPKQLCLSAIAGCTAMDVAALMRKYKQDVKEFFIESEAELTSGYPAVFKSVDLQFYLNGEIDKEKAIEAVLLSQTKYCGVSAMMAKHCPIYYKIYINSELVNEGQANFS
ncbi:MAG: OsmC family protein [Oligoflexia bacterium]|nr:OsmC family protein [Oligoflexia bacterium]